jgi:hypothetical protein
MRDTGLYTTEQIREVNELRMRARWRLGALLTSVERGAGPGRGKMIGHRSSFLTILRDLELPKTTALEAQRIGALKRRLPTPSCSTRRNWTRPNYEQTAR